AGISNPCTRSAQRISVRAAATAQSSAQGAPPGSIFVSSSASLALRLHGQRHSPAVGNKILLCDTLDIVGGDLIDFVERSEQLPPIAIGDRVSGEQIR